MSILLLFPNKIYACRDKFGRTPIIIGSKKGAHCAVFESSSFVNLEFKYVKDLGPGEIVSITNDSIVQERKPNEKMKVEDLFKAVAIGSANDATVVFAEKIAGTEDKFVELMNKKAKELGLKDTNFKNAVGLDEANHYSSAYDMAFMALELVKHEKIFEYTTIYEDYLRQNTNNKFWLVNTNKTRC